MRKFLAFLVLLAGAVFWAGCGKDSSAPNANSSTGTTTYNKPDATTAAPSGGGMSNSAAPGRTPAPGIKPPTEK